MTAVLVRIARAASFLGYFCWELLTSNAVVAWEVLTPRSRMSAGIVEVPVRSRTDRELALLTCLLSLTPGTLPLHVDTARSVLYVHGLHVGSPRRFREAVRRMEDHMLRVMR